MIFKLRQQQQQLLLQQQRIAAAAAAQNNRIFNSAAQQQLLAQQQRLKNAPFNNRNLGQMMRNGTGNFSPQMIQTGIFYLKVF